MAFARRIRIRKGKHPTKVTRILACRMGVANLKISKLGGLTKIKQARDLCISMGIAMTLEDSWGGDIATAAIAHLAHSTPTQFLFTSTGFNSYVTLATAEGAPKRSNGRMAASTQPGLGVRRSWPCWVLPWWLSLEYATSRVRGSRDRLEEAPRGEMICGGLTSP